MMKSVREIIKEACVRINLVPRRQAIPGDIMENAYLLLQGIVSKYNNDNLLAWTQNNIMLQNHELIHIYDTTDVLKGEHNLYFDTADELHNYELTEEDFENDVWAIVKDSPNVLFKVLQVGTVYTWQGVPVHEPYPQRYQEMKRYESMEHVQVRNVAKINSLYMTSVANQPYNEMYKLDFVNHTDFDKYSVSSPVFTYTQKSENEWLIQLKPVTASQNYRIKLNYNESVEFDIDSDLYIPDNYVELLIVALAHKLALQYPRLDDAHMQRLENEVRVLVDNVRTPKASDRMLVRDDYFANEYATSQYDLLTGRGML